MSHGLWYVVAEALRTAIHRPGAFPVWAMSTTFVLIAGMALFVLSLAPSGQGPTSQVFLLATLSPLLSEEEIDQLYYKIQDWDGVAHVWFRFKGEMDPVPITERTLVVQLTDIGVSPSVQGQLLSLAGVDGVQLIQRIKSPIPGLPPISRILALVSLVVALGMNLWFGRASVVQMANAFSSELSLLHTFGLTRIALGIPFFALGAVIGFGGAVIYLGCYWGIRSWAHGIPAIRSAVPALFAWEGLATALGVLAGVFLGAVGGAMWYSLGRHHS